jgi:hypothetical protein
MSLCKYKDIFGKLNAGLHAYRIPIVNLAFVDILLTVLIGYALSYYFKYSFSIVLVCLFILAIIIHRLFCVRTTIDKFLFPIEIT